MLRIKGQFNTPTDKWIKITDDNIDPIFSPGSFFPDPFRPPGCHQSSAGEAPKATAPRPAPGTKTLFRVFSKTIF
jgi:hypothetical protein